MKKNNKQGGFTIIEVMIAMVVMTILISVALTIVDVSNTYNARARNLSVANDLALGKMQEYELMEFGSIPVGSSASNYEVEDFTSDIVDETEVKYTSITGKVFSEAISGSLKSVRVEVVYEFGADEREIIYATYIQIDGVGR